MAVILSIIMVTKKKTKVVNRLWYNCWIQ